MGIAAGARDFAALDNEGWFSELVTSGFRVAQPVGVFPRLELPVETEA
jgi:methionyl-tRNA synthetase